ncbi:MAG TPA: methyltransferase domain-containing protein [Phycisphaerales bacterium]|nr:methyltransferase domain-containing protein [Phycisphaerales bacterium]
MSHASYIHGTSPDEQARLAGLNRLTNADFVAFVDPRPRDRVLEIGCGLGLLAREVAGRLGPGGSVAGVELRPEQIEAGARLAKTAGGAPGPVPVRLVVGDARALPFCDASFDLVYCRYLLEHVADPARVLRESLRVLVPGGRLRVQENDITLVRLDPPCPAFERVWELFAELQRRLGGDALVGRRLFALLRRAGFESVELALAPEVHWHGSPRHEPWVRNLMGNVGGARSGLVGAGLASEREVDAALAELEGLIHEPDASATFSWNRAAARRPA